MESKRHLKVSKNPLTNKQIHTMMYEFNEEKENLNKEFLNSER